MGGRNIICIIYIIPAFFGQRLNLISFLQTSGYNEVKMEHRAEYIKSMNSSR